MNHKLLDHPKALVNQVRRIAVTAGEATLRHFDECGYKGAEVKSDGSPVTVADREAEEIIIAGLQEILPDVPVVGEESVAAGVIPDLTGHRYFWLVDPLDGTKEFVNGSGEYTVNIALIKDGEPVMGVVYAPVIGELYASCGPDTAVKWSAENGSEKNIRARRPPADGLVVVSSRSHGDTGRMEKFLENYKVAKIIKRGSSLKICAVAAGKADIYPRLGLTCEWDTAAGHAILKDAGGDIVDFSGNALRYGKAAGKFLNPEFCARGPEITIAS